MGYARFLFEICPAGKSSGGVAAHLPPRGYTTAQFSRIQVYLLIIENNMEHARLQTTKILYRSRVNEKVESSIKRPEGPTNTVA
jgi:hypothetical protein